MPMRSASRAIFFVPTEMPTAEKTALSEYVSPPASVCEPAYLLSKLLTTNFSLPFVCGTVKIRLRDGHTEPALYFFSASARMNGFIDEPGWRWPWVARLNGRSV